MPTADDQHDDAGNGANGAASKLGPAEPLAARNPARRALARIADRPIIMVDFRRWPAALTLNMHNPPVSSKQSSCGGPVRSSSV